MTTALSEKLTRHPARMETLLAELIEAKLLSAESLVVRPRSLFRRGYSPDIVQVKSVAEAELAKYLFPEEQGATDATAKVPRPSGRKNAETTVVDVSREGFYDALPEFLFHAPEAISGYKNLDQRVKESEKVREEEARARKFFLPFEQEFFRQRIRLEQEERKLLSGLANPMQRAIFEKFWTDVKGLDESHEAVLFYLLPSAHKIAGNRPLMAACFEAVLQDAVSLDDTQPIATAVSDDAAPQLGEATLGFDFVAGEVAAEDLPDLSVNIGPLDLDALPDYLEGGKKHNLLSILYSYFVPAEMDVQTQILLKQMEAGFVLNDDDGTARLAFSTYI